MKRGTGKADSHIETPQSTDLSRKGKQLSVSLVIAHDRCYNTEENRKQGDALDMKLGIVG